MLPLSVLTTAVGSPMLVELKNGLTYNGTLRACDTWMNLLLVDAVCTSKDGEKFWKHSETYIRGNTIKYVCVPDEIVDRVPKDEDIKAKDFKPEGGGRGRSRGGRGGAGRGGAGGRGRGGARGGGARGTARGARGRGRGAR